MDSGTTVYRAYVGTDPVACHWVDTGIVADIVSNGIAYVRLSHGTLVPITDGTWHERKIDAQRDIHTAIVRHIGKLQAQADKLADEILHADLASEAVPA